MEILLGLLGLIVTTLVALVPYYRRKKRDRPRIDIYITLKPGTSRPLGLSYSNDFSKGYVEADTALRWFHLEYNFELRLVNNSDFPAYYPRLFKDRTGPGFTYIEELPSVPITNTAELILKASYITQEECQGSERSDTRNFPKQLQGYSLLLEYQNNHGRKFYTLLELCDGSLSVLLEKVSRSQIDQFEIK